MLLESQAVKEMIKANASEIYKDAAQPSVRVVGKSLAQCVSLFAVPVGRMAEIFEKNIHRYLDKLDKIPENQLISPNTRVLVPILEKLRYTDDEVVADYYAEILATASTKEHAKKVLVTFIEILNRLSADEIKILEFVNSNKNFEGIEPITEEESKQYSAMPSENKIGIAGSIPIVDINIRTEGLTGFASIKRNTNLIAEKVKLLEPDNIDSYIDNMMSLGLLERQFDRTYAIKKIFDSLKNHKDIKDLKKRLSEKQKVEFTEGRIDTTDLGLKLLELCSKENRDAK